MNAILGCVSPHSAMTPTLTGSEYSPEDENGTVEEEQGEPGTSCHVS